jgi:hypothetical protein
MMTLAKAKVKLEKLLNWRCFLDLAEAKTAVIVTLIL